MSGQDDSRERTRKGRGRGERIRGERIRREDPERQEPDRGWQGWFQSGPRGSSGSGGTGSGDTGTGDTERGEAGSRSPMDTVERGVKMAYQVVEDYIDQGRKTAQRINDQQYGPREMTDDFQALTGRMMRDSARFLSLWFEMVSSTLGVGMGMARGGFPGFSGFSGRAGSDREASDREGSRGTTRRGSRGGSRGAGRTATWDRDSDLADPDDLAEPPEPPNPVQAPVAFEVRSPLPTRVQVDLPRRAAGQLLHVTPLRPLQGQAPPLEGVTYEPGAPPQPAVIALEVPPDQPPGPYHGTLVDPETHRSRGTLTVIVSAASKAPARKKRASSRKGAGKTKTGTTTKKASTEKTPAKKTPSKKSGSKESR